MRPATILLLNACFVGAVFLACARGLNFWGRIAAVLFLGLYLPTILLMRLIPEHDENPFPPALKRLVWPLLMLGWMAAGMMLLGMRR
jgi:hypothetical protein